MICPLTANSPSVAEGGSVTFELTLDKVPTKAITVSYATAAGTASSGDYTSEIGTVTFAAGQQSQLVTIATTQDTAFEPDETFTITFSGDALSASVKATATITNDDPDPATAPQNFTLTSGEALSGNAFDNTVSGLISSDATKTTFHALDAFVDTSSTDADVFTLTTQVDITANNTGSIRNVETVQVNVDATTLTDTNLDFAATNFVGTKEYKFDVTKAVSAVSGLVATGLGDGDIVTTSPDFTTLDLTVGTVGDDLTVNVQAAGTAGTPAAVTINDATDAGDVVVTGAGYLTVTSNDSTGLIQATAEKGLTLSAEMATVQIAQAKAGNLTVSDASSTVVGTYTASGNISITDLAASTKLTATAGGTITLATNVATTNATLSATGTSSSGAANTLSALNISGNGASATYDFTAGSSGLEDVTVSGDKNVTLQVSAASIDAGNDILNVYDESSVGTFTLELKTAAGNVDTRAGLIDVLKLKVDNATKTLSVASGQKVTVTADQAGGTIAVGVAAAAASNTVTIALDDATRDASAVDLDSVVITQAKTVVIDGSIDSTSTGAAVTHTIDALNASGANSNVTINMGANNLIFDGTVTAGTGTITVTGSGTVADATTTLAATTFDASAMTGAVTLDATTINVANVKTGSGNDTVVLTNNNGGTFYLGAGNDKLTLDNSSLANTSVVIDMGDGTDTLYFDAGTKLIKGTTGSITVSGLENIVFSDNASQEIQASLLNGATYSVAASAVGNARSIGVIVGSTDTNVDLSALNGSTAAASTIAGMTFVTDASANAAAVSIKGVVNALNTITGSAAAGDVLTGGDKADNFVVTGDDKLFDASGVMLDTIAGGASAASTYDTVTIGTTGSAVTIVATDNWSKLTGVEQIAVADNTAAISIVLGASAESAGVSRITLAGDSTGDLITNTLSVAAYTTGATLTGSANKDVITGGAGADTITGGALADTISGGDGDDIIVYALTADLFSAGALVDTSVAGGNGTDTIRVGTTGTAFAIAATDAWTGVTSVEKILAVANTAAVTIDLDSTAWAAGVRTVDISAGTKATGNLIDASEITGGGMTLIGSATGATTITGGSGADTLTGGTAADTFETNGGGADTIVFAATAAANGSDTLTIDTSDILKFSNFLGAGYGIVGELGATITAIQDSGTADVNITGKLAVLEVANADAGAADTAAELFALINGTGNAFAISAGRAVVIVNDLGSVAGDNGDAYVFFIDTTADGVTGLSAADITLVGTATNIAGTDATWTWAVANFA